MSNSTDKNFCLRFPADGSNPQLVSFSTKTRTEEDGGHGEFFDNIPDLAQWYGNAYTERRFSDFYIGNAASSKSPGFVESQESQSFGHYCLYYNLSPLLPINRTCLAYVDSMPPPGRLFWRGDLFLVKYDGELGMGHNFVDTFMTPKDIVKDVIRKAYDKEALESIIRDDDLFQAAMARERLRRPAFHEAIESGAFERFRTGQPLSLEDVNLVYRVYNVE